MKSVPPVCDEYLDIPIKATLRMLGTNFLWNNTGLLTTMALLAPARQLSLLSEPLPRHSAARLTGSTSPSTVTRDFRLENLMLKGRPRIKVIASWPIRLQALRVPEVA